MNVRITGGAGYIGSHTNRCLHDKGVNTVVLDDLSDGHLQAVICGEFVRGCFGDRLLLDDLMDKYHFDAVIHFAAFASVPDSVKRPSRYYHNNVSNMQTLLDACVAHGVKHFVFSSFAATFGEPKYTPIDEDHSQSPINPYGTTKLIGEKMLAGYEKAYGLKYCAFRYFCAAGSAKDARIGEAHWLGLHRIISGKPSDCFNLGSGEDYTVLEMIQALSRICGKEVPYVKAARREGDPVALVSSGKKAKSVLGWVPMHSAIDEILSDAWNWELNRRY